MVRKIHSDFCLFQLFAFFVNVFFSILDINFEFSISKKFSQKSFPKKNFTKKSANKTIVITVQQSNIPLLQLSFR